MHLCVIICLTLLNLSQFIVAAVGSGLYVYNVPMKSVVAYRKIAHDSNVLHTMLQEDGYERYFLKNNFCEAFE